MMKGGEKMNKIVFSREEESWLSWFCLLSFWRKYVGRSPTSDLHPFSASTRCVYFHSSLAADYLSIDSGEGANYYIDDPITIPHEQIGTVMLIL